MRSYEGSWIDVPIGREGVAITDVLAILMTMQYSKLAVQKGFTLIESLVVLSITAILLTIGVPSMSSFIADWQLSNAVNAMSASLQLARTESLKRGRLVRMCPSTTGTSCATGSSTAWETGWLVYVDNDGSGATYSSTTDALLYQQSALTGIATITSNQANKEMAFGPNGLMTSAGRQGFEVSWDTAGTKKKVMCVSRTGRTRMMTVINDCTSTTGL